MYIQPHDQPNLVHQSSPFPPPHEVFCIHEVTRIVKAGRSTIYKWMKDGLFPKAIKLGPRAVRWRSEEIFRWLAEREMA